MTIDILLINSASNAITITSISSSSNSSNSSDAITALFHPTKVQQQQQH